MANNEVDLSHYLLLQLVILDHLNENPWKYRGSTQEFWSKSVKTKPYYYHFVDIPVLAPQIANPHL
ncbi:MAG: hypothetical protein IPP04_03350 [Saprospiraceae bacterium]|nr:hypothetical protein [Saprospiraceae bacterium]